MSTTSFLATLIAGTALAGCGTMPMPIGDEFAPVPDGPVRFDNVVLAEDRRSVRIDFIGSREFDPDNPCSNAYEGTAEIVGDELEIGIYAQQHPKPLAPGTACDAMGHPRTLALDLDEPFTGTVVRDVAGQVFLLEPPAGLAQVGALPEGWDLRREGNVLETTTPRWERIWSPDPDPWPAEGDSMLILIQAFGGPVGTTGGDVQQTVDVNGLPATMSLHPPAGEMVLVWSLGGDELALVGNLADFSESEFIELAASVAVP